MKNNYILLRHGQTIYQTKKKGIIYPSSERNSIPLTAMGRKQIEKAAKEFKNKKIDLIYSSDFLRTKQTSGIIGKKLGLKVKFDKRLRDINSGIYRGKPIEEYKSFFSGKKEKFSKRPPKGENWRDIKKRMVDFLKDIEKKHKNKTILIISHGDPLWLLVGVIKKLSEKEFLKTKSKRFYLEVGQFLEL